MSLRSIAYMGDYACRKVTEHYKKVRERFPKDDIPIFNLEGITYFIDATETEEAIRFRVGSAIPRNVDSGTYFASVKEGLEERLEEPKIGIETESLGNGKRPVILLYLEFKTGELELFVEDLRKEWSSSPNGKSVSVIIQEGLIGLFKEGAKKYFDALIEANNQVIKEHEITIIPGNDQKRRLSLSCK